MSSTAPARIRVSLPPMLALEPSVTDPPHVLLPLILRNAPLPPIPLPLTVSVSAPTVIPPCSSKAAPLATVTPPAMVPVPCAFWTFKTPTSTAVAPA